MDQHRIHIEDGTLAVELDDGWLEVGEMDAIYDLFGGETYTIEYDDEVAAVPWLSTDDGDLTVDVSETLADISFDDEFVRNLRNTPLDEIGPNGYPVRTELFADLVTDIWDSKGNPSALNDG